MILKFTCPSFELDFAGKELNIVEENHWFNDQFFTKYSFPFEFDIDEELDAALEMITHNNARRSDKTFEGYLQKFGGESEAILVIERIQGKRGQGKMRYGLEEFPNFDKKLSELPLEQFRLEVPIADFALARLDETYPAVNFNFPQLIVDHFDTNTAQWLYFEGIINNYKSGAFLKNEYNSTTAEQINRNIMQPVPYLLYVLAQGFADAGLELRGEILQDPEFKDAVITMISDYYSSSSVDNMEATMQANEYSSITRETENRIYLARYAKSIFLPSSGIYKVSGNIIIRSIAVEAFAELHLGLDNVIWRATDHNLGYEEKFFSIDLDIDIPSTQFGETLRFISEQLPFASDPQMNEQDPTAMILDLTITKIAGYDLEGNLVPTLVSPEKIDLQKCVPDMTFGDVLKALKNWKNYDVTIGDGYVEMNKIKSIKDATVAIDLTDKEVKEPIRNFYQDNTFILQLQEVGSDEYKFAKLFVDSSGSRTSSFVKNDNTKEITINGIPLPMKESGGVSTAHLFTDAKSILALSIYPGLDNGLNTCRDTSKLLIPAVYQSDWKEWIDFRINSEGFEWPFFIDSERAGAISEKSKIYAYAREFIVRRVSKKNVSQNWWEITLECDGAD
jgi:hypothetical protein